MAKFFHQLKEYLHERKLLPMKNDLKIKDQKNQGTFEQVLLQVEFFRKNYEYR